MNWSTLIDPLRAVADRVLYLFPKVIGALIILILGWVIARILRQAVVQLLHALRIDRLVEKAKLSDVLQRGGIPLTMMELLGELTFWLVMLACTAAALQFMGMTAAAGWLEQFGYFIPRIILSVAILLAGMLLAGFFGATVRAASLNAGIPYGPLLGQTISTGIILLTVLIALEQLHVVTRTIEMALYIMLASCGLAFSLAVGLGAKDLVRELLAEMRERWRSTPR